MTCRNESAFRAGHAIWAKEVKLARRVHLRSIVDNVEDGILSAESAVEALLLIEQRAYQRGFATGQRAIRRDMTCD